MGAHSGRLRPKTANPQYVFITCQGVGQMGRRGGLSVERALGSEAHYASSRRAGLASSRSPWLRPRSLPQQNNAKARDWP